MIETQEKSVKNNELLVFFNKYLALDYDESYIINLVDDLTKIFESKLVATGLNLNIKKIEQLKYNSDEDFKDLKPLERVCLKFYSWASIEIEGLTTIYINKFGTIITFDDNKEMEAYIGKNIFELLNELDTIVDAVGYFKLKKAKNDARNVINQNILVSKIYNAIKENILEKENRGESFKGNSEIFTKVNEEFISYESDLNHKYPEIAQINTGYPRIRSRR